MADADGLSRLHAEHVTLELFARPDREELAPGACVLRGHVRAQEAAELRRALDAIEIEAPFRHMITPGGFRMSVAMTNCGAYGWVSSPEGYRYAGTDPVTGAPWPALPPVMLALAREAAAAAGYLGFTPDACIVNRYEPGARLTLHQDKDERDFAQPIVSVSLGVPATFLFGGQKRKAPVVRLVLEHGDVVVWGGPSRLRYHGVAPLKETLHPFAGSARINLTLRHAR